MGGWVGTGGRRGLRAGGAWHGWSERGAAGGQNKRPWWRHTVCEMRRCIAACFPLACLMCLMQASWVVLLQDYDYDAPVKLLDKVGVPTAL